MRRLFLVTLLAAGCGGSSAMPPGARPELDPFLGAWTITTGQIKGACGAVPLDQPLSGMQTVERGTDSDLVYAIQPSCRLLMDASGNTATVRADQSCTVTAAAGYAVTGKVSGGSMRLTGPNASAFSCDGSATLLGMTCTFTITGSATK
jgi:hypothetical protein